MKRCLLAVALLSLPAFGETITGAVEKIGKDQFQIKGSAGPVTFQVDERTVVRKAKTSHDLSVLVVGDDVRVSYYGEGTLIAVNISARITLSGVITESNPSRIILLPSSASCSLPPGQKTVFVFLDRTTKFGTSRSQFTAGRRAQVVGWDAGDGVVDAEKVAVYDTDLPARPPSRPKQ